MTCGECKWWERVGYTQNDRGRCFFPKTKVPCAWDVEDYFVWQTEGADCPCFEPKDSTDE
jgi:hypothetical protein